MYLLLTDTCTRMMKMNSEEALDAWRAAVRHKDDIEKDAGKAREAAMGWREKVRAAQTEVHEAWQVVKSMREATGDNEDE